jgi:phenylacetate-CoA ligase
MIRRAAYWGLDLLKGGIVRRHIRELESAFRDPDAALALTQQRVRALVDHACRTTGYYRQFLGAKELSEFPVLQKRTIREHYQEFFSSAYDKSSLVPAKTSGSYGAPFTFYLTREKKARQHAEVIYFSGWAGYRVGDKHAFVRLNAKDKFALFMQNEILLNPTILDQEWLEKQRQVLLCKGLEVFIGFPSVVGALAEYCQAKGDGPQSFRLKAIITMAEPLNNYTRVTLRQVFGCPVLSRYSTEELGVLAHECDHMNGYHLNIASYVVELLSLDSDAPVSHGELGRVVVTDPFSYAMPLIRYDTGDLAVLGAPCSCGLPGPTLRRLEGRVIEEVVGTDGQILSPFVISNVMEDLDDGSIVQFQFVQKGERSYELRLCVLSSFHQEELVCRRLLDILGADAELELSYTEQIPPLPSGKRPYVINEWRQPQLTEMDARKEYQ